MWKGLGHLVRSMFGLQRSGRAAQPDMERTIGQSPGDTLRQAMDAASRIETAPALCAPLPSHPWPVLDDHDLPTLFLHGRKRAKLPRRRRVGARQG
jgi:hypothetical protein